MASSILNEVKFIISLKVRLECGHCLTVWLFTHTSQQASIHSLILQLLKSEEATTIETRQLHFNSKNILLSISYKHYFTFKSKQIKHFFIHTLSFVSNHVRCFLEILFSSRFNRLRISLNCSSTIVKIFFCIK